MQARKGTFKEMKEKEMYGDINNWSNEEYAIYLQRTKRPTNEITDEQVEVFKSELTKEILKAWSRVEGEK